MRTLRWIGLTWFTVVPALAAQSSELAVEAGLGYARVFDGGGVSLEAAVDRPMTAAVDPVQHALGLSFWYARRISRQMLRAATPANGICSVWACGTGWAGNSAAVVSILSWRCQCRCCTAPSKTRAVLWRS
jgi:hypothetical protein